MTVTKVRNLDISTIMSSETKKLAIMWSNATSQKDLVNYLLPMAQPITSSKSSFFHSSEDKNQIEALGNTVTMDSNF